LEEKDILLDTDSDDSGEEIDYNNPDKYENGMRVRTLKNIIKRR